MALALYNLLLTLFSPLICLYLLRRRAQGKEDRNHWGERWGRLPPDVAARTGRPRIWVHAVSVGEVMAAVPVLRELRRRWPDAFLLLSTTTVGGREVALKQSPLADAVVYYPLDFRPVVGRALGQARPDAILLMEWEIWPNFLTVARRRGAKIAVLNGRISDKGLRRGRRGGFFTAPGLAAVDSFAMQSDEDARRAAQVGADPGRVRVLGNTKFDESVSPLTPDERAALRADLGIPEDAPVWVCGSTRPGEEAIVAAALTRVVATRPDLLCIVAPRHLDRADEAAAAFEKAGFGVRRRSRERDLLRAQPMTEETLAGGFPHPQGSQTLTPLPPPPQAEEGEFGGGAGGVLLLDTFGELARVYAVADVAFVGGSLLPFGGQSVFQPLAQGAPALFGPYMNNQRDIAALATGDAVGFEVADADALAREVLRIVGLPESEKVALAVRAQDLIARNQGVSARCVDLVAELLAESAA